MAEFPHLNLKQKLQGRYQFAGRRIEKKTDPQTEANLKNREAHGNQLREAAQLLARDHATFLREREEQRLPDLFDDDILPIFLQVDPKDFDIEALKGFGIEIVSEEEDGFIIGANTDSFRSLTLKIDSFLREEGRSKDQAGRLWQIIHGTQWRVDYILSEELRAKYNLGISDTDQFTVDISVACYLKMPERPVRVEAETDDEYAAALARHTEKHRQLVGKKKFRERKEEESDEQFEERLDRWRKNYSNLEDARDAIASERQNYLTNFVINIYGGELLSSFIDLEDSFGFKAKMSGRALKDLIRGYAYVFEISESEQVEIEQSSSELANLNDIEILEPSEDSPTFCVIDSGMQEQHILLSAAIKTASSKNYVPYEDTTADSVPNGGHGTKVAGAILYGNNIPISGVYQPPCFLLNARILDSSNYLPTELYPPQLMEQILSDFDEVRLFNMSVASRGPCRLTHMSTWAAVIDQLIHERQVLFVLAAGNIMSRTGRNDRPGISEHLQAGRAYPDFLLTPSSRIANPAQSLLALTVGSVSIAEFNDADRISFGKRDYASAFSRSGPGMWGCVKPDVVEYGGDFLREKNGFLITQHNDISAQVVHTGANRQGFDVGTSFAAPKVAHIVAQLAKKFPNDSTLLYKALIIQSARLPEHVFHNPGTEALRHLGYGIPDPQRALENNPYRVTFVAEGSVAAQQANLYSVTIPAEINRAGTDFDILVEVTLTFTAAPRRTRKKIKSYLSSWLSWESSKLSENFEDFSARILRDLNSPEEEIVDNRSIRWTIWSSPTWGRVAEFKRQDSATQKDWVVLKSNALPRELSFAIVGHKGWSKDITEELPFALAISFEAISRETEIYNLIEVNNRIEIEEEVAVQIVK
ncbi:S8 family peptidase [Dyadobacter sp. CY327]|uniref:S8 family peptidase n=1 Tax=Dyadobacter sp. CY327 TaxID=2907301 RepID=UPI001F24BF17|nr:S8 family peptidase [Dyadobacter sp. CY327]MCE7069056.1 S8 family peptidase [Dyadobacter sp. CY327]